MIVLLFRRGLPVPFHVGDSGVIARQDVWGGRPVRVLGFCSLLAPPLGVELPWSVVAADPQRAVGLYAVTVNADGSSGVALPPVDRVEVR